MSGIPISVPITRVSASAYTIPIDAAESDGTLEPVNGALRPARPGFGLTFKAADARQYAV